jgi:hypothetical protein
MKGWTSFRIPDSPSGRPPDSLNRLTSGRILTGFVPIVDCPRYTSEASPSRYKASRVL